MSEESRVNATHMWIAIMALVVGCWLGYHAVRASIQDDCRTYLNTASEHEAERLLMTFSDCREVADE